MTHSNSLSAAMTASRLPRTATRMTGLFASTDCLNSIALPARRTVSVERRGRQRLDRGRHVIQHTVPCKTIADALNSRIRSLNRADPGQPRVIHQPEYRLIT